MTPGSIPECFSSISWSDYEKKLEDFPLYPKKVKTRRGIKDLRITRTPDIFDHMRGMEWASVVTPTPELDDRIWEQGEPP